MGRPKSCDNSINIKMVGTYSPLHAKDAELPDATFGVTHLSPHQNRFMSSQHENYNGIVRVSQPLPLDLNSFKYLNADEITNKHLLFSEWIELNEDD